MTQEAAEKYSHAMMSLAGQARSVVRDLNPKVTFISCLKVEINIYILEWASLSSCASKETWNYGCFW